MTNKIASEARKSLLLYEGGARSKEALTAHLERLYGLYWIISSIDEDILHPQPNPKTEDRRRSYATTIKLQGGQLRPEYE